MNSTFSIISIPNLRKLLINNGPGLKSLDMVSPFYFVLNELKHNMNRVNSSKPKL